MRREVSGASAYSECQKRVTDMVTSRTRSAGLESLRNVGVGGGGVDVESSGLQSRTMLSRLISEVEYDKCKHVTAVNSTNTGLKVWQGSKSRYLQLDDSLRSV